MPRRPITPVEVFALIFVLLIAAGLRMGAPGVTEFKRDEANLSHLALDLVRGRSFPLLGIDSSVGIRNAPWNIYVVAPPFLLSSDPTPATLYVGLLNVIAVFLLYLLARHYYGSIAAIMAALLYAVAPWAVIFSRKIWAQDLLPVFVLMTIGTGLLGFLEGKRWAQWLHLPLLAITGQIHYGAFVLLPITLYLIITGRRKLTRDFWFSIGLAVLVTLPYLIGMAQGGYLQADVLQKIVSSGGDKPHAIILSSDAIRDAVLAVTGIGAFDSAVPASVGVPGYPDILFAPFGFVVLLSALWLIIHLISKRDDRSPIDVVLLFWLLFTPLVFTPTWTTMYTHYTITMLPAAFLVVGVAATDLWHALEAHSAPRRLLFMSSGVILALFIVLQIGLSALLLWQVDHVNTPGGFATPLNRLLPIRAAILEQKPQAVIANLDGQYIGFHDETTIWNTLLYDVSSVRFIEPNIEVYPAESVIYLSHQCIGSPQDFYLRPPGEGCYTFKTRTPADFDSAAFTTVPNAEQQKFANGARLLSYHWTTEPNACLSLAWAVAGPVAEDYQVAVHFTDAQQHEIVFGDGIFWRGRYWRAGDKIVRTFCPANGQERKAEIVGVHVGMYTQRGATFNGVNLLDANSKVLGQSIEISLQKS